MHGEPKVVESASFLACQPEDKEDDALTGSRLSTAAACAVMLEEHRRKAAKLLEEAEFQRNTVLAEAKAQVEALLAEAQTDALQCKTLAQEEGRAEGYQSGHEEGRSAAKAEMEAAVLAANEKAQRTMQIAENEAKCTVLRAERQILDIVLAIADRVIPQHFMDAPQCILPLIQKALEKVKDQNAIVVRVSEENYEFVLAAKDELQMRLDGDEGLSISADPVLGNDGCIIESANGNVDAKLQTQLEIVKKAVQEVMP